MNNRIWALSLMIIGLTTIAIVASNIANIVFPDLLTRILGVLDLIALFALAFTTVKKIKNR